MKQDLILERMTLKTARNRLGLSQIEASKILGISVDTLGNYERGKSYPDIPVLKKIEELYQVTCDQLIFLNLNNALSVQNKEERSK